MTRQGWVSRDALIQRIDAAAGLVAVTAEGGAGKTVLVGEWLRGVSDPDTLQAWVTFEEHDRHSAMAWRKFLGVLRAHSHADFGKLATDVENGLLSESMIVDVLIAACIRLPDPVIVCDDLHLASEEFQLQLVRLLRPLPHLKIVSTSRQVTVLEREAVKLSLPVTLITSQDLVFTFEDSEHVLRSLAPDAPTETLHTIHRLTSGHALSTRIVGTHLKSFTNGQRGGSPSPGAFDRMVEVLPDYLPAFADDSDAMLAMRIAHCPLVTAPLAAALLGEAESVDAVWERVKHFEASGLGRIVLRSGVATFTFHTLIAAALRAELLSTHPDTDLQRVYAAAFQELQGIADVVDVFRLGLDGDMRDDFFAFFARNFSELSLHRTQECLPLLRAWTDRGGEFSWQISLCHAVLSSETPAMSPVASMRLAQQSLDALEQTDAPASSAEAQMHALARMTAYRVMREYERAADHGATLMRLLGVNPDGKPAQEVDVWRPVVMQVFVTNVLAGRLGAALEISPWFESDTLSARYHHFLSHLSFIYVWMGDYAQAQRVCDRLAQADRIPNWDDLILSVGAKISHAVLTANETEPARGLAQINELVPDLQATEMWPAVVYLRATLRLLAGQARVGLSELETTLHHVQDRSVSRWWRERFEVCRAELVLAGGQPVKAARILERCAPAPDVLCVRALIQIPLGKGEEALRSLEEVLAMPEITPQIAMRALTLRAVTERGLGYTERSAGELQAAIDLARRCENRLVFGYVPRREIERLREAGGIPETFMPHDSPFVFLPAEDALSERELEVLDRLAAGGATIEEVAGELFISVNTIKTHLKNIYRKLQVSGRAEAVAKYRELYLG